MNRRRGATLTELLVYVSLMLLIVAGATVALVSTFRSAARIEGRADRVRESSRITRRLASRLSEATFAVLPTGGQGSSWPLFAGVSRLFISQLSGSGVSGSGAQLSTGVLATLPARYQLTLRSTGGTALNLPLSEAPFRRDQVNQMVLVYRGDTRGFPNSQSGTCLWLKMGGGQLFQPPVLLTDKLTRDTAAVRFDADNPALLQAQLQLQQSALAPGEGNPITFSIKLENYTPDARASAAGILGY